MRTTLEKRVIKFPGMSFEDVLEAQKPYINYLVEVFGVEAADKYIEKLRKEYEKARKEGKTEITVVGFSVEGKRLPTA